MYPQHNLGSALAYIITNILSRQSRGPLRLITHEEKKAEMTKLPSANLISDKKSIKLPKASLSPIRIGQETQVPGTKRNTNPLPPIPPATAQEKKTLKKNMSANKKPWLGGLVPGRAKRCQDLPSAAKLAC